jgi:xanthine dehydrogenase accessory factor
MKQLFEEAVKLLKAGEGFAFATILSHGGSAPRGAGAKMLILPDRIVETIGGGGMEADVIRLAREEVIPKRTVREKYYNLSAREAAVSDFICGGSCDVLIAWIGPSEEHLALFAAADDAVCSGEKAWFVYRLDGRPESRKPFCLNLYRREGGLFTPFPDGDTFNPELLASPLRAAVHGETGKVRYSMDSLTYGGTLYLFGAGHVSQEVAKIAVNTEFQVIVIDDRKEYANETRFPGCEIVVLEDFSHIPDFPVNQDSYILIITRGHVYDKTVLAWALRQDACYVGMIGSVTKRDTIYRALAQEGYAEAQMSRVCCPVGLKIGGETPAEIAVSIAAELIQKRSHKGR